MAHQLGVSIKYLKQTILCNFRLCMVNYIILYKKFVEHHVIKLILLKISSIEDIFNKINLITWCSTNFLYKIKQTIHLNPVHHCNVKRNLIDQVSTVLIN